MGILETPRIVSTYFPAIVDKQAMPLVKHPRPKIDRPFHCILNRSIDHERWGTTPDSVQFFLWRAGSKRFLPLMNM